MSSCRKHRSKELFILALDFGSACRFERNYPATAVSVLVQYMRGWGERMVRMGDSGSDVGGWVGFVTVGFAGYRSLKMDPFTLSS